METNEQMNVEQTEVKEEKPAKAEEPKTRVYTDAEVDEIINKRFAKWQKEQDRKVEEAKRLEQMNAEEKAKYERDALQKELDQLKAEKAHAELAKTAKSMVVQALGVQPQDGLVDALVKDTAEATSEAVKGFVAFFKDYFKMKVSGGEPKKGGTSALTKDEIFKIKDPHKRLKAIEENMELFKKGN